MSSSTGGPLVFAGGEESQALGIARMRAQEMFGATSPDPAVPDPDLDGRISRAAALSANTISFSAEFTSADGAQGLLSVFWDGNLLGMIDERHVLDGPHAYALEFPAVYGADFYSLSFRLDGFSDVESSLIIERVRTGFVHPAVAGDANLDGEVTFADFQLLEVHFGGQGTFEDGDFNEDSIVDFADFLLLRLNFGATGAEAQALEAFAQSVPEPGSISMALVITIFGQRRRLRRDVTMNSVA
jgi:hypothetical protein